MEGKASETKVVRPEHEVADVIRGWGEEFLKRHPVTAQVRKTLGRLALCRTRELGGHVDACPECGEIHISYNSCRDRHCPKCQGKERELWVEARKEEVMPVTYFHAVFTVPDCLHKVAIPNQAIFYSCMFRAAWATLDAFFHKAKKNVPLQGGLTAILHTWGSKMFYHPHLHCIVPGGGVDKNGRWHHLKHARDETAFLFSVRAMSVMYRAKFMDMLTKALARQNVDIPADVRKAAFAKPWVVYCRPPARRVEQVIEYLGRYAYRVAISNRRIKDITPEGQVSYDYKDYKDLDENGIPRHKMLTMHAVDFLHLFSLHILPTAFVRIRHYGILAPCNRAKVREVQKQLQSAIILPEHRERRNFLWLCEQRGWTLPGICRCCGSKLQTVESYPNLRAPPGTYILVALHLS